MIDREAEGERAERLRESLTERMDAPDWEEEFADLPAEEVIAIICRELRLDPVRTTVKSPLPGVISPDDIREAGLRPGGRAAWPTITPQRRPDG